MIAALAGVWRVVLLVVVLEAVIAAALVIGHLILGRLDAVARNRVERVRRRPYHPL